MILYEYVVFDDGPKDPTYTSIEDAFVILAPEITEDPNYHFDKNSYKVYNIAMMFQFMKDHNFLDECEVSSRNFLHVDDKENK
jgi:hypothetical protein